MLSFAPIVLFFSFALIGAQSPPNRPLKTSLEAALHQRRVHINSNQNDNNLTITANNNNNNNNNNTHDLSRRACGVATFTQMTNPTGVGVVSQQFSDLPTFSTISMDDFVSPSFPSVICSVTFLTETSSWGNGGPIVVRIYADSGGMPSPIPAGSFGTPLCEQESATSLGPASSITLNLGNGTCGVLPLLPNTPYWIAIDLNCPVSTCGQMFWEVLAGPTIMSPPQLINPGEGFGFGNAVISASKALGLDIPNLAFDLSFNPTTIWVE